MILLSILFFLWNYNQPRKIVTPIATHQDSLKLLNVKVKNKEEVIAQLNQELTTIRGTKIKRELKYIIKKDDTLFELAKLFYNDSTAWYQIALDNKIYDVRGLPIGDTLTLKYREN